MEKINKSILVLILLFSIFALIAAYFIEYILGHQPCNLCLLERIPYILAIIVITFSFIFKKNQKIYLILLILIFTLGALLSFYHFGIEQGFFKESLACATADLSENLTKEELLKQLSENTISCKDVSFRILGFSLAAINTIFSIALSVIFIKLFISYEKN